MSGTDSSPEATDKAGRLPPRGIEPPAFGYGPPPAPDFGGIVKTQAPHAEGYPAGPVPPYSPPQRTSFPWAIIVMIAAIAAVVVLLLGLAVAGIGNIVSDAGESAPSSENDGPGQSAPDLNPFDSAPDNGSVESSLQAMIDEYKGARDNGALWKKIPDTDFNRTAVSAFLYFLLDMKLAASMGGDTTDYLVRANDLEQKLLNEEPLGDDISIKLSDRTFTYDGDTGEGGYTAN